jgi:hypothetical protein
MCTFSNASTVYVSFQDGKKKVRMRRYELRRNRCSKDLHRDDAVRVCMQRLVWMQTDFRSPMHDWDMKARDFVTKFWSAHNEWKPNIPGYGLPLVH